MARMIAFTCADCQEMFEEPVQTFVDAPGESMAAPQLCEGCGHGGEDYPDESSSFDPVSMFGATLTEWRR